MKVSLLAAAASCFALVAYSQTFVNRLTTQGVNADNEKSIFPMYKYPAVPVVDVQSTDLICRSADLTAAVTPFKVAAGSIITVRWDLTMKSPFSNQAIVGPCSFWLAKQSSKGTGPNWSKINEHLYEGDDSSAEWCSARIGKKDGYYEFTLPKDIAAGIYYFRSEIIDIGDANISNYDDFTMGPRFHSNCFLIEITGDGKESLKNTVDIMEVYKPFYKKLLRADTIVNSKFKYPGPVAQTKGPAKAL
ncbi:hypothetical protein GGF38_000293 [Coemansia sp. RSA 25]|nr:hypothetical protein GGF38_000293 [Coemansia sp. RSA 25]